VGGAVLLDGTGTGTSSLVGHWTSALAWRLEKKKVYLLTVTDMTASEKDARERIDRREKRPK